MKRRVPNPRLRRQAEGKARKPRVLRVGSRQVVVATDPLEEKPTFKTLTFHRAGEHLLILKTSLSGKLIPLVPFLVGVLLFAISIAQAQWPAALGGAGFLFVAAVLCLESLLRIEIDAGARRMRTIWLWKRWDRPLQQLLAVQLSKDDLSRRYYLTLILDDQKERRTNLAWYGKEKAARDAAQALAAFVRIPLLDEVSGGQPNQSPP